MATAGAYDSALGSKPKIVRWFISWWRDRSLAEKSKKARASCLIAARGEADGLPAAAVITARHSVHAVANIAS